MNSVPLEAGNTAPIEFKQITNEAFAVMTVSEHGLIYDCSQKGANLLGWLQHDLIGRSVADVIPKLASVTLLKQGRANTYLRFLSRIGHHFELIGKNGKCVTGQISFSDVQQEGTQCLLLTIQFD
ncbi:MAG: PAS domain-containing protein [Nitrosomonas sp.]|nr:PAS domain-containing protein [Nitrosomonas sp.]MBK7364316.1 PAS domain-containing protein [Nitrosomonas sp.]